MAMAVGRDWAYYIVSHHDHHRAGPGGQHLLRRAPGPGQPGGTGQLPPPPVHASGATARSSPTASCVLAVMAGALLIAVGGNTNTLIPLFAIGVFIGFTLSQTGLVVHWRKLRPPGWRRRAAHQRDRRGHHRHRHHRLPDLQVHRGGLGGRHRHPGLHLPLPAHPRLLRAGPPRSCASTRRRCRPEPKHTSSSCRSTGSHAHRARPVRGRVARPGGHRGDGRPARRGRRQRATSSASATTGAGGTPACRSRSCTPTTRRSSSRSSPSSTSSAREHPDDQIVVLIPVIRPDKLRYRILHNQIDLVLSSALRSRERRRRGPGLGAPRGRRAGARPGGPATLSTDAVADCSASRRSAPLPHRVALLDEGRRALLGVLAAEDLRLPLGRQRARLLQIGRRRAHELLGGLQRERSVARDALGQRDGRVRARRRAAPPD